MAPMRTPSNKAWRLATGIALVTLGVLVIAFGAAQARLDIYGMAIAALNCVAGLAMILFQYL